MIYIKTTHVGVLAQAAADRDMHITIRPSMVDGCTQVMGVQDQRLYQLAVDLGAMPAAGKRWPGDTGT